MEKGDTQKVTSVIKILYKENEKAGVRADLMGLTYPNLLAKLTRSFKLNPDKYYQLHYTDSDGDVISIRNEQDFQIFLESPNHHKLYLQNTTEELLHFKQESDGSVQAKVYKSDLHETIEKKRQEILSIIDKNQADLFEKLKKEIKIRLEGSLKKAKQKSKKKGVVHKNISCSNCKTGEDIIGTRYECIKCSYNLCEDCEVKDEHVHPLIKFLNEKQALVNKNNILLGEIHHEIEKKEKPIKKENLNRTLEKKQSKSLKLPSFLQDFRQITRTSEEEAADFYKKHPCPTYQALVDRYFQVIR